MLSVISSCQFFRSSMHQCLPTASLAAWFKVQQHQNGTHFNILPVSDCQSKVLWPSLSKLFSHINHFLKFISLFHDKISFLSHLSDTCLYEQMKFHFFNILIGSVHSQSASFSILHGLLTLYELFMPLSNICFLHNFWVLCIRQHCRGFACTPPSFGKNFKLIIYSNYDCSFCNERYQQTHTHTYAHMSTFS
jgi:hypothetical protein